MKKSVVIAVVAMLVAGGARAATYSWTGGGSGNNFDNPDNWDQPKSPIGDHREAVVGKPDYAFNTDAEVANLNAGGTVVNDAGWSLNVSRPGGAVLNIGNGTVFDSEWTRAGYVSSSESGTINVVGGSKLQAGAGLSIGNMGASGTLNVTDSSVTLDGGARIYIGYDGDGTMTLNGASSSVAVDGAPLFMSYDESVDSTLTINDGLVDGGWFVQMGGDTGTDTGTSRIILNGGALKANQLFFHMADAKVVLNGGRLLLHAANVSTNDLKRYATSGRIEAGSGLGFAFGTTNVGGTTYSMVEAVAGGESMPPPATYTWTGAAGDGQWNTDANWSVDTGGARNPFSDYPSRNSILNDDVAVVNIDAGGGTVSRDPDDDSWSSNFGLAGAKINVSNTTLKFEYTRVGYYFYPSGADYENGTLNLTNSVLLAGGQLVVGEEGAGTVNVVDSSITPYSGGRIYIGFSGDATMVLDGASSSVAVNGNFLYMSYYKNVNSTLTINDGLVDGSWGVQMGGDRGTDTGTSRIILNGGALKANELYFNMADAKVVLNGGKLLLHGDNVSTDRLRRLAAGGRIEAGAGLGFSFGTTNLGGATYSMVEAVAGGESMPPPATYTWTGAAGDGQWNTATNWSVDTGGARNPFSDYSSQDSILNDDVAVVNIDAGGGTVSRNPDDSWSSNFGGTRGGATINVNNTTLKFEYTRVGFHGFEDAENGTLNLTNSVLRAGEELVVGNVGAGTINMVDSSIEPDSGGAIYIGYDGDGAITLKGASSSVVVDGDSLYMSYFENVDSTLAIYGGTVDGGDGIVFGGDMGSDGGTSRIYLNGGEIKANNLEFNMADAKVVVSYGKLLLQGGNVTTNQLQSWVDNGDIDVSGGEGYSITTEGDYSVLEVDPVPTTIRSFSHYSGDVYKMVVDCPAPVTSYPLVTSDLVYGSWGDVGHSDSSDGPFTTNSLGVESGTYTIYVKASGDTAFFGIGEK